MKFELNNKIVDIEERKKIVEEIIDMNKLFFLDYFDNYFNVNLRQDDKLCTFDRICKQLNYLSNYLDYLPQREFSAKWRDDRNFRKCMSLDDYHISEFRGNYYKNKEQIIKKNENLEILQEYQKICDKIWQKINTKKLSRVETRICKSWLFELKNDMCYIKDCLLGTIYFVDADKKNISGVDFRKEQKIKLDLFQKEDCEILFKILPFGWVSKNIEKYVEIYYKVKEYMNLNDNQKLVLEILENGVYDNKRYLYSKKPKDALINNQDLVDILGKNKNHISKLLSGLVLKFNLAYIDWYTENIYYIDKVKGTYKKCNICGENKPIQLFDKKTDGKHGVRNICKKCRNQ